jgi:large subunit ribosomal protein L7/L12
MLAVNKINPLHRILDIRHRFKPAAKKIKPATAGSLKPRRRIYAMPGKKKSTYKRNIEMADLDKIVEELGKLSVLEAAELVKKLEEAWGVSAAAPVAMAAAGPAAAAAAAEPVEEQTEFDVVIKEAGAKKIEVIKVIRQLTSLGLKEAKDVAETAGAKVLEAVSKEAANDAKGKLEAVGAVIEVK